MLLIQLLIVVFAIYAMGRALQRFRQRAIGAGDFGTVGRVLGCSRCAGNETGRYPVVCPSPRRGARCRCGILRCSRRS